jgi:hypothetical protein
VENTCSSQDTYFLWLLANNKTLTKDNLAKRQKVNDKTCLFCNEDESTAHLFFSCCVAKQFWCVVAEITGVHVGVDFESMAKWWLHGKKFNVVNVINAAVL